MLFVVDDDASQAQWSSVVEKQRVSLGALSTSWANANTQMDLLLRARVHARLRTAPPPPRVQSFDDVTVERDARRVLKAGTELALWDLKLVRNLPEGINAFVTRS